MMVYLTCMTQTTVIAEWLTSIKLTCSIDLIIRSMMAAIQTVARTDRDTLTTHLVLEYGIPAQSVDAMMINYNGYDATTQPVTPGEVPEFYWFLFSLELA